MPLISVLFFFVFLALLVALNNLIKYKKKFKQAELYGIDNFDIDVPTGAAIHKAKSASPLPSFIGVSNAEAFFMLITPYIGSLNNMKRDYLYQHMNDLKNDLKMHKAVYQLFMDEYKVYEGLDDEQAAEKWSEKS